MDNPITATASPTENNQHQPKRRHWIKNTQNFGNPARVIFFTILIFFTSQILASIFIGIFGSIRGISSNNLSDWVNNNVTAQFGYTAFAELMAVGLVLSILRYSHIAYSEIGLKKPQRDFIVKALLAFGSFYGLLILAFAAVSYVIPSVNTNQQQDIGFNNVQRGPQTVLTFISLVVLPPIGEEILMRGYLFSGLRRRLNFAWAALLTSLLFGIAHLQLDSGTAPLWTAAIDTFVLSLVLVYLRENRQHLGRCFGPWL